MVDQNPFYPEIRNRIHITEWRSIFQLTLVGLILPLTENFLISKLAAATGSADAPYIVALVIVFGIHLISFCFLAWEKLQSRSGATILRAYESAENEKAMKSELLRREKRNDLVRLAFSRLTQFGCSIDLEDPKEWCFGCFCKQLEPIVTPFIEEVDNIFGVKGMKWSLEVHFEPHTVPTNDQVQPSPCGLEQHAFYSYRVDGAACVQIQANCSAARSGMDAKRPFEQHVINYKERFFDGDKPKESVYFRRYACVPIYEACTEHINGVIVLTSMQDEPFASDVLDTLAFISTVVSS